MSMVGMNIDEVKQLAQQMQQAASQLQQMIGQITNALNNAQWVGPDRDRFVSDWQQLHTQALNGVANGLNQAAQTANVQVQKQETASQ
jgi:uncharacterized protein YukE